MAGGDTGGGGGEFAGAAGGGQEGGRKGGTMGGGGGNDGGGEGARRTEQSSQSKPNAHPAYSAPGPPSSQTPSLAQPCSAHWLLQIKGGGGGEGGGIDGGGGGGGEIGGEGGSSGDGGAGGGARGATTAKHTWSCGKTPFSHRTFKVASDGVTKSDGSLPHGERLSHSHEPELIQ